MVRHTSPDMFKMKKELGGLAGQSSLVSKVISGIGSSFTRALVGILFTVAIYKIFIFFVIIRLVKK
ncbi:hypothetical protein COE56_29955 [Bacillus anthracis]|nr:hypothetical protein COE56_29955 [Bacillus anthracis]